MRVPRRRPGEKITRAVICIAAIWALAAGGIAAGPLSNAEAASQVQVSSLISLRDLPLIEVRATGPDSRSGSRDPGRERDLLAVHLTGDGGWGVTDRGLAKDLAANGIPVVALNSMKYFWTKKTVENAAADLERILRGYLSAWGKKRVVLIGYSLGADVLPFMLNRIPTDLQEAVRILVLMGPSETVEFQFHLMDWLGRSPGKGALPVLPEINKVDRDIAILCLCGEKDSTQVCDRIDPARTRKVTLPTGHRFGADFAPISAAVLEAVSGIDSRFD